MERRYRLQKNADFQRVRRTGRSAAQRLLVGQATPSDSPTVRIGISVGKRVGNAVVRNRIKRRIRAALRPKLAVLPAGWDVVIVARSSAAAVPFAALAGELELVLRRLALAPHPARAVTPARRTRAES